MRPRLEQLEEIVRTRICAICPERESQDTCSPQEAAHCSLFQLFPLVAQAILATDSSELEDYVRAIRENVCSVCLDQALDGSCDRRGVRCTLDACLPQLVDVIEEAIGRPLRRRSLDRPLAAENSSEHL
jgi:hypothetical protein